MRDQVLDMIEADAAAFLPLQLGIAAGKLTGRFNTECILGAAQEYTGRPNNKRENLNALLGLPDWPGLLRDRGLKDGWRLSTGEPGIEAEIVKGALYISAPRLSFIEETYDEPAAIAHLRAWQPPAGLREVPSPVRHRSVGFPRVSLSPDQVHTCRTLKPL